MVEAKFFAELGLRKEEFEFSKPKETSNGGEDDEEVGQVKNGNGGNGNCPKKSKFYAIKGDGEPKKSNNETWFNWVFCRGQRKSVVVDTGMSNLFISEKVMGKLGLSISKLTKKIKTINFKEISTVGVV
ncbi:hypothetical protein J1N35_040355 [Gossypium stocksii]|uniref:Aspartyl protease n=1 Tax=Gossypium stocksii TaxID=47602 RepID=A0A9D3UDE6_9ROSI|nr:hypothetical protein J1N35_040355 [Gossypium stocksii]